MKLSNFYTLVLLLVVPFMIACAPEKEIVYVDKATGDYVTPVKKPKKMRHVKASLVCLNGYQHYTVGKTAYTRETYIPKLESLDAAHRLSLVPCNENTLEDGSEP